MGEALTELNALNQEVKDLAWKLADEPGYFCSGKCSTKAACMSATKEMDG